MINIHDVLSVELGPTPYLNIYPFSVTLHVPESHRLTIQEKAVIQDAIVHAAQQIRLMREPAPFNFAWIKDGIIDWDSES